MSHESRGSLFTISFLEDMKPGFGFPVKCTLESEHVKENQLQHHLTKHPYLCSIFNLWVNHAKVSEIKI